MILSIFLQKNIFWFFGNIFFQHIKTMFPWRNLLIVWIIIGLGKMCMIYGWTFIFSRYIRYNFRFISNCNNRYIIWHGLVFCDKRIFFSKYFRYINGIKVITKIYIIFPNKVSLKNGIFFHNIYITMMMII